MSTTLERHFAAIGARLEVRHERAAPDYRFDVVRGRRGEYFDLRGSRIDDLVVQHRCHLDEVSIHVDDGMIELLADRARCWSPHARPP